MENFRPESGPGPKRRGVRGARRLTLGMVATERLADDFGTVSEGGQVDPGRVLAAFKAAAPYLRFGPRVTQAIDWLFRFTQVQDWQEGARPIVWPSAAMQMEALCLSEAQVKRLNRLLAHLGLITMRDSPNGKRYGRRDPRGRIVEAYGFVLSPIAVRQAEFREIAERGRARFEALKQLRRRATIAVRGIQQIVETAAELGIAEGWARQADEARRLVARIRRIEELDEVMLGVTTLEHRQADLRGRLEAAMDALKEAAQAGVESTNMSPKGLTDEPHITHTNQTLNPTDHVSASRRRSSTSGGAGTSAGVATRNSKSGERKEAGHRPTGSRATKPEIPPDGTVFRMTPDELVRLAPRLRAYLAKSSPGWPEIVEAADWLRHDLGVSKPLWGEACLAMGREQAAVALAIVSTKPSDHFRGSPGGYFHGMVARARAGELNLARSIWGIRAASGMPRPPRPDACDASRSI